MGVLVKNSVMILIGLQLGLQTFAAAAPPAALTGRLQMDATKTLMLSDANGSAPVPFTETARQEALSLVGKAPFVQIWDTTQVPTIVSGDLQLEGHFVRTIVAGQESFSINGVPVKFGRTKKVNGTQFDERSRAYFNGKDVRAMGSNKSGIFEIESILRRDVFSAAETPLVDAGIPAAFQKSFDKDPVKFVTRLVRGEAKSPSPFWFRKTVFSDGSTSAVRAGDPVLLITASGAQADSGGAVNGHFAVGLGHVGADQLIDGEMFNVYVTNEKEIVPGNVNLTDYYGHLVSGQQNYRPTYTLAIYGLPEAKILQVKAELDRFHPLFRSGSTKITVNKNCATLSVQSLGDIGFYGTQRNGVNGREGFPLLSKQSGFPPVLNFTQQLEFVSKTKRAEFMPGPAFVSMLQNLRYLNETEHLGMTRADFIFGGQTPSARKMGGAPTTGLGNQLDDQRVILFGVAEDKIPSLYRGR
jgi:hypothetical protein